MQYYCPASVRIRSRGAFRNPSLYAEKTESRSNSCKGFFAEHLSELMLAFSSHLSNSSGLYPYISAYLRFFINLVIIKKAGRALKGASPARPDKVRLEGTQRGEYCLFRDAMLCTLPLLRHTLFHHRFSFVPPGRFAAMGNGPFRMLPFWRGRKRISGIDMRRICYRTWDLVRRISIAVAVASP
jgi:hypothetical protein